MTETSELLVQIKLVAKARQDKELADQIVKKSREEWEAKNADILHHAADLREVVAFQEDGLRTMTIEVYNQTGNKKPCQGVGIRELTKLDYELKTALAWATEHKIALALDKKAFEGIAKQSPLDFVTTTTEIQATIAAELTVEEA
uniref:Uncharacterized protein n=1 Tax=viral metagenome TaxID=1070528 RepID=A0A6M3LIP0_9ZZZZ